MKKLIAILLTFVFVFSMSGSALADVLVADANGDLKISIDGRTISNANETYSIGDATTPIAAGSSWTTNVAIGVYDDNAVNPDNKDIIFSRGLSGDVSVSGPTAATLSETSWEIKSYDAPDTVKLSGIAPSPSSTTAYTYDVKFQVISSGNNGNLEAVTKTATITVWVAAAIPVDTDAPTIVWDSNNPATGANVWHNTSVSLAFKLYDPSGVDTVRSTQSPLLFNLEGPNQTQNVIAYDLANPANHTIHKSPIVNIDWTPPTISGSADRGANAFGWYNDDVTVSFDADDALSGLASVTAPQTLTKEGANQSVIGTAVDKAGNSAGITVAGINIDKTAPVLTYTINPTKPDGSNDWYKSPVTVEVKATDAVSGFESSTLPGYTISEDGKSAVKKLVYQDGVQGDLNFNVTDKAGNNSSVTVPGFKVDTKAPIINAPSEDCQIFVLNSIKQPNCSAIDDTSGVASTELKGFTTSTVGIRNYTFTATDNAGNTATITKQYKVVYKIINVKVPAVASGKSVKAGSAVPISWQYGDDFGTPVDSANASPSLVFTCMPGNSTADITLDVSQAAGASGFQYDQLTKTWQFNWKTSKSSPLGSYTIAIRDDQSINTPIVNITIGK
jgi:hypothetical protein